MQAVFLILLVITLMSSFHVSHCKSVTDIWNDVLELSVKDNSTRHVKREADTSKDTTDAKKHEHIYNIDLNTVKAEYHVSNANRKICIYPNWCQPVGNFYVSPLNTFSCSDENLLIHHDVQGFEVAKCSTTFEKPTITKAVSYLPPKGDLQKEQKITQECPLFRTYELGVNKYAIVYNKVFQQYTDESLDSTVYSLLYNNGETWRYWLIRFGFFNIFTNSFEIWKIIGYSNLVVQIGYIIKKSHKKILRFFFGSGHVIAAAAVVAPVVAPILAPVAAAAPLIATASAALSEADRFGRNRYWSEDNEEDSNYERDREIAENQAETERLWRAIEDLKKKSKNTMQQRAKSPRRGTSPGPKKRNTRNC